MLIRHQLQRDMFDYDISNERAHIQLQYDVLHMLFLNGEKNSQISISVLDRG